MPFCREQYSRWDFNDLHSSCSSQSSLPNQNLIYLEANNLYEWAMSQSLPTFLQQDEISTLKLQELSDDAEDSYIFEVDLYYPTHLHDRHYVYPLAPESLVIDRSLYSSTQQAIFPESTQRKLTPNLLDKVKYIVHHRNLKLYLQLGLVVIKVHRVLTSKQSPWFQHSSTFISWRQFLKGLLQIDEQQCIWEDAREFEEPCTCRTDYRRSYFTQTGC